MDIEEAIEVIKEDFERAKAADLPKAVLEKKKEAVNAIIDYYVEMDFNELEKDLQFQKLITLYNMSLSPFDFEGFETLIFQIFDPIMVVIDGQVQTVYKMKINAKSFLG